MLFLDGRGTHVGTNHGADFDDSVLQKAASTIISEKKEEEKLRREERVEEEVVVCDGFGQNVHRIVVLVGQIQADVHGIVGVVVGSCGAVAGMVHVFRIAVTRRAGS